MIFNEINFEDYLVVEYIRRPLLPPIEVHGVQIPGRAGQRFTKSELGENIIQVDIRIIEANRAQAQLKARQVAGLLYTTEPKKLILRDQPNTYNMAMISGDTDFEKFLHTGFSTLSFVCKDPASYSLNETVIPNIQSREILNDGTLPSRGILTVQPGNTTNLRIVLQNTGEYIYLKDSFTSSDTIVIDMEEESIRLNGNLIMTRLDANSDFFDVPVGKSTITTTSGAIQLRYRRRWVL